MRHILTIVAVLFALAVPAWGQTVSAPNAAAALSQAVPAATPNVGAVTAADLRKLVTTLQNDSDRAQLIQQLQALIAVQSGQPAPAAAATAAPAAQTVVPDLVEGLTTRFQTIGSEMVDVAGIARAAPSLGRWLERQAASPEARLRWLEAFIRLIVIFGAAAAAGFATGRLLRGLRARFALRQGGSLTKWLILFVVTLILDLLPIAIFAAVATLILAAIQPHWPAQPIAAIAIATILRAQAILVALRVFLVSPASPYFLHLGEETRTYLYIWARRFVVWLVYGFGAADMALALHAPHSVGDLILRFTVIVVAGLAIVFVLQNRANVAGFLRSPAEPPGQRRAATTTFRAVRGALADTWHILAIVYIVGSFGAYLVDLHGGVGFVLRATVISILVLLGAGLAMRLVHRLDRRGVALGGDLRMRFPGLEARTNKYIPALIFVVSALVYAVAIVLLLQTWGIDALDWLKHQYIRDVAGTLISIVIVVAIAIAIWEIVSAAVERALGGGDPTRQFHVNARLRTLLPLIRSTVLIAIVTIAGFVVLSQIGLNIAPLLAGAGIVGIAVGFGSQQLVHDIINGLFILIENTVTVGDWVDVGGGHAGTVEEISIRSLRLRDGAGAVHTIPYSSVAAITNTNRGIGNAGFAINVALGTDTDRVSRILIEIGAAMRKESPYKAMMRSEYQFWGIDKVDASTVTISGQIVCTDAGRWPVQREFNRRMMLRFQQEGIAFALPTQSVIVQQSGKAPDVQVGEDRQVTPLRAPRERG
jgi:small conductance mechanosensitive channel